jgi:peroxiredoxin Q/BCP
MLKVGDKAPDFTLTADDGKPVSLSDFAGKQVVLYFYPKASTPGCTIEACDFRDLRPKFAKQDIVVLGVSADPVKALVNFKAKQKLNFPLLSDPDHKMIESYGQWRMNRANQSLFHFEILGAWGATPYVFSKSAQVLLMQ